MKRSSIFNDLARRKGTLLCAGPMSRNCVDVVIELANQHSIPIVLIASRRQIDSALLGGGYVERWDTESFVRYVKEKDAKGKVFLARDHGGPWQHSAELGMGLAEAMRSAKQSYTSDIEAGLQLIHIDPSIDPGGTPSIDVVVDRVFELYHHCWEVARKAKKDIAFEIGTEDQSENPGSVEELERILSVVRRRCEREKLPAPLFVVGQIGTKVAERQNIGTFMDLCKSGQLQEVRSVIETCDRNQILLKVHNVDYLPDGSLAMFRSLGVHAANVAPEFGVNETVGLLQLAEHAGAGEIAKELIALSFQSRKWEKWVRPGIPASERERAILCGHYIFATPEFRDLKQRLAARLSAQGLDLDELLRQGLRDSITRYLTHFGAFASVAAAI